MQLSPHEIGQFKMTDHIQNGSNWEVDSDNGQASQWNFTKTLTTLEDIKIDANFAWLIFSLLIALIWFTYITHYSSRVIGQILTRLLNRFVIGNGYLRIGNIFFCNLFPYFIPYFIFLKVH